jgi:hypothetical protein
LPRALAQLTCFFITVAQTVGGVRQLRTPCAAPAATGWIRAPPSTASKGTTMAIKDKVRSDKISDPAQIDPRLGPDPKPTHDKVTAEVTYIPGDGEPHRVTWA